MSNDDVSAYCDKYPNTVECSCWGLMKEIMKKQDEEKKKHDARVAEWNAKRFEFDKTKREPWEEKMNKEESKLKDHRVSKDLPTTSSCCDTLGALPIPIIGALPKCFKADPKRGQCGVNNCPQGYEFDRRLSQNKAVNTKPCSCTISCKYTAQTIKEKMNEWVKSNPEPVFKEKEPILTLGKITLECCTNIIENVGSVEGVSQECNINLIEEVILDEVDGSDERDQDKEQENNNNYVWIIGILTISVTLIILLIF